MNREELIAVESLKEALKYCLWKLEMVYAGQHENYEFVPTFRGKRWHTKETYRATEEGKQFAVAIELAKNALKNAGY